MAPIRGKQSYLKERRWSAVQAWECERQWRALKAHVRDQSWESELFPEQEGTILWFRNDVTSITPRGLPR